MGNAICFIRLFYKPDIQFVLEDLVTDYSVNSQIITITRERRKIGRERWIWRGSLASTVVNNGFGEQDPSSAPSEGGWRKARLWRRRIDKKGQVPLQLGVSSIISPFSNLQILLSPTRQ